MNTALNDTSRERRAIENICAKLGELYRKVIGKVAGPGSIVG